MSIGHSAYGREKLEHELCADEPLAELGAGLVEHRDRLVRAVAIGKEEKGEKAGGSRALNPKFAEVNHCFRLASES